VGAAKTVSKTKKEKDFNVLEHELVPKHRIMSEKEVKELLKKLNISLRQLPRILASDAALQGLNAKPNDVIEITRKSRTTGVSKYYRVVVIG